MLTYFLVLLLYSIKIIQSTCVDKSEPIVGASDYQTEYVVQMCLRTDLGIIQDRLCIRSIDGTANYSPYLDTAKDYPNIFFKMRFVSTAVDNARVKLINVKNGRYLASLPNGFIFYSPTDDDYSTWDLVQGVYLSNYGVRSNTKTIDTIYLCTTDNYNLKICHSNYANKFAIITTIFSKTSNKLLKVDSEYTPYLSSFLNYVDSEKWSLEFKGNHRFSFQNFVSKRYLTYEIKNDNGKEVCRIFTTDSFGTIWITTSNTIISWDKKIVLQDNSNLCIFYADVGDRTNWFYA